MRRSFTRAVERAVGVQCHGCEGQFPLALLNTPTVDPDGPALCPSCIRADRLQAEVERLNKWVDDLQSGMFINCAFCGEWKESP